MHYPRVCHGRGRARRCEITAKFNAAHNNRRMGNRDRPTELDKQKIDVLYSCLCSDMSPDCPKYVRQNFTRCIEVPLEKNTFRAMCKKSCIACW